MALGRTTASLLYRAGWIHRRKESVELLSDTWVRREMEVDFTIPQDAQRCARAPGGDELFLIPVCILPKAPPHLMRFEFRDEGAVIPLPTRRQSALTAYAAMLWASWRALDPQGAESPEIVPRNLRDELFFIAAGPIEYTEPVSQTLRSRGIPRLPNVRGMPTLEQAEREAKKWAREIYSDSPARLTTTSCLSDEVASPQELQDLHLRLARSPRWVWLVTTFALTSPIVAPLATKTARRKIAYVGYDQNLLDQRSRLHERKRLAALGWASFPLHVETSYVAASNFHFECVMPDGLEVVHSSITAERPVGKPDTEAAARPAATRQHEDAEVLDDYEPAPIRGPRVHHYLEDATTLDSARAVIELRVARDAFVGPAFWAALAITLSIGACAALAEPLVNHSGSGSALLLLFPGLLATLIARAGGHGVIIRMLSPARRALLASGLYAYLAAALFPMIETGAHAHAETWVRLYWGGLAVLAGLSALTLGLARALPRPHGQEGELGAFVAWLERRGRRRIEKRALRRQKRLAITITAEGLTWERARELVGAAMRVEGGDVLPLTLGPLRRWWLVTQDPAVRIIPIVSGKPLLRLLARPTAGYLEQHATEAARLAATIRWLCSQQPRGFRIDFLWPRLPKTRWYLWRWAWRRLPGVESPEPVHCRGYSLAALARARQIPMNRSYVVEPEEPR